MELFWSDVANILPIIEVPMETIGMLTETIRKPMEALLGCGSFPCYGIPSEWDMCG